jgi:alanine dehydrogenase
MVASMRPGAVMVDVAIDQGGCFATSHPTTHSDPTYLVDGVIHYCVTNMPGAVARTSTLALSSATVPYGIRLASQGFIDAVSSDEALGKGVNVMDGKVTQKGVAEAFNLPYVSLADAVSTHHV